MSKQTTYRQWKCYPYVSAYLCRWHKNDQCAHNKITKINHPTWLVTNNGMILADSMSFMWKHLNIQQNLQHNTYMICLMWNIMSTKLKYNAWIIIMLILYQYSKPKATACSNFEGMVGNNDTFYTKMTQF